MLFAAGGAQEVGVKTGSTRQRNEESGNFVVGAIAAVQDVQRALIRFQVLGLVLFARTSTFEAQVSDLLCAFIELPESPLRIFFIATGFHRGSPYFLMIADEML